MYRVRILEDTFYENEYFNKKENAVNRAKELFTQLIYNDYWSGSIEKFDENNGEFTYKEVMKNIETGDFYYDQWIEIEKIKTKD